ncbi:MAG: hypothetical protein MJ231_05385 [bacterium]|nr:hypothetical protein [bacterium]
MKIPQNVLVLAPAASIAVSLIAKDAVGCYLYVTQARSNKKMTPKQRADVANYDLANGIINIGLQLAAVKPIEKLMTKLVDKKFMDKFFKNRMQELSEGTFKDIMSNISRHEGIAKGAVAVLSVIICQYLIKRVLSPYLSVPAGEWAKQKGIINPKLYDGKT